MRGRRGVRHVIDTVGADNGAIVYRTYSNYSIEWYIRLSYILKDPIFSGLFVEIVLVRNSISEAYCTPWVAVCM